MLDYIAIIPPYLMFNGSTTTSELRISLVDDNITEEDQQFSVHLMGNTPNVVITLMYASVTIIDDDGK